MEEKPKEAYQRREHVMPQCFGVFKPNNFVLRETVCDDCNQDLGDKLELQLGRDTIEGVLRYKHGVKPREHPKRHKRIKLRVSEGELKGLIVIPVYSEASGRTYMQPVVQVGFYNNARREYDYFEPEAIPIREFLEREGYDLGKDKMIRMFTETDEDADRLMAVLKERGINFKKREDLEWPESVKRGDKAWTEGTVTIDPVIYRVCQNSF